MAEIIKDQQVWISSDLIDIKSGTFVSSGGGWFYILTEDGKVQGFSETVVFDKESAALRCLIDKLKLKIIYDESFKKVSDLISKVQSDVEKMIKESKEKKCLAPTTGKKDL